MNTEITILQVETVNQSELDELFSDIAVEKRPPQNRETISSEEYIVCAFDDKKTIGLAYGSSHYATAIFEWIYVHTEYRSQGLGSKLSKMLLDFFSDKKRMKLVANRAVVSFYQRLGFSIREDAIPMMKNLKDDVQSCD